MKTKTPLIPSSGSTAQAGTQSVTKFWLGQKLKSWIPCRARDNRKFRNAWVLLLAPLLVLTSACQHSYDTAPAAAERQIIYLVRHAEKTKDADDPGLTEPGKARAQALSNLLRDANITRIHSSDYIRTRDTAAPLAARLGLEVELYDPSDLPAMAALLKTLPGIHLVVGHSNTTPQLTELLGGDGGEPIIEATEYDRLYIVTRNDSGAAHSILLRFGE